MRTLDLRGQRFGRLVAIERSANVGKRVTWACACDCGARLTVLAAYLIAHTTKSCGCYRRELSRLLGARTAATNSRKGALKAGQSRTRHGHAKYKAETSTYRIWLGMIQRCHNPTNKRYVDWGGRGIRVCDLWHTFDNFLADMGERPSTAHSIDRIDNDGNYELSNCRWATASQQNSNRRSRQRVADDRRRACL